MLPKTMLATVVAAIVAGVSASPIDACAAPSSNKGTPQPAVVEQVVASPVAIQPPKVEQPKVEQPKKLVLAPSVPHSVSGGTDPSLSQEDNFYWNLPEKGIFANMSLEVKPGYRLLNGNNFADLVDRVDCSANSTIKVTFSNDQHIKSAQKSWAWVNKEPANTVIFVVDGEKCGGKHGRQPYFVTAVQYNVISKTASMKASTAAWESFVQDAELEIKGENQPSAGFNGTSKRFLSKNFPINIGHDFSQNLISTDFHGVNLGFDCLDCSTHGTLDAAINLSFSKGFSASVTMRDDVALRVGLGLSASGAVAGPFLTKSIRVGQLGLPGFSIGGIAEIGPQLTLDAQATLGTASAKLEAKFGGVMSFENGQKVQIGKGATATLHPTFSAIPPSIDGDVSIAAKVNPLVTLNLSALFFGKGITGGVALAAPILSVSAGASVSSTNTTCGGHASVNFAVDVGVEVDGFAGFGSPGDLPNKTVLFALNQPLINQCVAILK